MNTILPLFIHPALRLILFIGLAWLILPFIDHSLRSIGKQLQYKNRTRIQFFTGKLDTRRRRMKLYQHLDHMLYLVRPSYEPGVSVVRFCIVTILWGIIPFLVAYLTISDLPLRMVFSNPFIDNIQLERADQIPWLFPVFVALTTSSFPYLRLRAKYRRYAVQGSYDLLEVIKLLSKHAYLNIDTALEKTTQMLQKGNVLIRPLRSLAHTFASYSNEQELRQEANRFSRSINTTFSINFISDLLYLEREGGNFWQKSLLNLTSSMERQKMVISEAKVSAQDAIAIGIWVNLFVFLFCIASFIAFASFPIYMRIQFHTKPGLILFSLIMFFMVISYFISHFLSKSKLDYH